MVTFPAALPTKVRTRRPSITEKLQRFFSGAISSPGHDALGELCPQGISVFMLSVKDRYRTDREEVTNHIQPSSEALGFLDKARQIVFDYIKPRLEKTDTHVTFGSDEVYVVWFSKTLQNWKALVSTTLPDGMYYEVTYNGDKRETYLDAYKKFDNIVIPD